MASRTTRLRLRLRRYASGWADSPAWQRLSKTGSSVRRSPKAIAGLSIISIWVALAILAPLIAPYSPVDMIGAPSEWPSLQHWLGTDYLGRDTLSRLLYGARVVLTLAPMATFIGIAIGASLGLISGYKGGLIDAVIMRASDVVISFPTLLIYILIITSIGPSAFNVVVAVSVGAIPAVTRIVRGLVLEERTEDYVSAAQLRGERLWYILFREILPNVTGPIAVDAAMRVGYAVMAIGTLGFLGLGMPPPAPDWGRMISEGLPWLMGMPWQVLGPAAALSSLVLALNMLSDSLRRRAHDR